MEITIDDIFAQLSERGRVEWSLAHAKAENKVLSDALQSVEDEKRDTEAG
mgnify:CR=1 FL=1|jgi:hypothetical protein